MENESHNLVYCPWLQPVVVYELNDIESNFLASFWDYVAGDYNSMSWYLPVFSVWFLIRIFLANAIWRKIVKSHAWSIWFITLWKYQFSWSSKSVYLISTIHVTISYSLISNIKMLSPGIPNSVIMPSIDRR